MKALVAAHGPPRIAEEFPAWPVPEWSRVDSAVYYTGERGVSDPGSYLMLTCGDRAVRGRLSMADLSWSFDPVPQPEVEPLVVNVMKTKEINLGIIPTVRGDTQRQTTNSLDAAMSSGDLQGGELPRARGSPSSSWWAGSGSRGPLQLVRGFRYRFVPVDFDAESPSRTSTASRRGRHPADPPPGRRPAGGHRPGEARAAAGLRGRLPEIRLTSVEQQGTTYRYTFTGELPGTATVGSARRRPEPHPVGRRLLGGPGGAESGLHLYVSQDFASAYPMQRSASDAVVRVEDATVVQLHYDVDPQSRAVSSYGSYVSVRGSTGSGHEFKVEEMFADYEGGGSIRTIMDKGATLTQVSAAAWGAKRTTRGSRSRRHHPLPLDGLPRGRRGAHPRRGRRDARRSGARGRPTPPGLVRPRRVRGGAARRHRAADGGPGRVYFLRQSPGRPTLHLPGAAFYVGEEPAADAAAYAGASGMRYLVWTAVLPSSWHLGEGGGPANQLARSKTPRPCRSRTRRCRTAC